MAFARSISIRAVSSRLSFPSSSIRVPSWFCICPSIFLCSETVRLLSFSIFRSLVSSAISPLCVVEYNSFLYPSKSFRSPDVAVATCIILAIISVRAVISSIGPMVENAALRLTPSAVAPVLILAQVAVHAFPLWTAAALSSATLAVFFALVSASSLAASCFFFALSCTSAANLSSADSLSICTSEAVICLFRRAVLLSSIRTLACATVELVTIASDEARLNIFHCAKNCDILMPAISPAIV